MARSDLLFSALFAASLLLILFLVRETEESQLAYLNLIRPPLQAAMGAPAEQEREEVRKDLFVSEKEGRLHAVIHLPRSTLQLIEAGSAPKVVETFGPFEGRMQEQIHPHYPNPYQYVRTFSGESGTFSFAEERLTANEVLLARYKVAGIELPDVIRGVKPEMKGVAESAELTFDQGFHFTAHHVKATFQLPERKR